MVTLLKSKILMCAFPSSHAKLESLATNIFTVKKSKYACMLDFKIIMGDLTSV